MRPLVAVAAALALSSCAVGGGTSAGSCVGPEFAVAPGTVAPGEAVSITLAQALDGCNDTGQVGADWAERNVAVVVTSTGTVSRDVATVDLELTEGSGEASLDTAGLEPGTYLVVVDGHGLPFEANYGGAQATLTVVEG